MNFIFLQPKLGNKRGSSSSSTKSTAGGLSDACKWSPPTQESRESSVQQLVDTGDGRRPRGAGGCHSRGSKVKGHADPGEQDAMEMESGSPAARASRALLQHQAEPRFRSRAAGSVCGHPRTRPAAGLRSAAGAHQQHIDTRILLISNPHEL